MPNAETMIRSCRMESRAAVAEWAQFDAFGVCIC